VEGKAADELVGGQRHRLRPVSVAVVLPAETKLAIVDANQAMVRAACDTRFARFLLLWKSKGLTMTSAAQYIRDVG
jgi:hypothetical protein